MKKTLLIFSLIAIISCAQKEPQKILKFESLTIKKDSIKNEKEAAAKEPTLKEIDSDILLYFKEKNYKEIAPFIHPEKGIRFSMYLNVLPETDQHFTKKEYLEKLNSQEKFVWGEKDGSGDLYISTLKDYLEKWVFTKDFSTASILENKFEKTGNSLNNLEKIYPNAEFMVNYIKGSEENSEMDWKNLVFVFEKFEGKNYLIAIVNDCWTI